MDSLDMIQTAVEVFLKENIAKAVAGKNLPIKTVDAISANQTVLFIQLAT
jgi:hypothetical protein